MFIYCFFWGRVIITVTTTVTNCSNKLPSIIIRAEANSSNDIQGM